MSRNIFSAMSPDSGLYSYAFDNSCLDHDFDQRLLRSFPLVKERMPMLSHTGADQSC